MVTGLALIFLPGCSLLSSGSYLDRELACESNPHDWWGTATRYVEQGNGEGGFDLDPPAEQYISRVQGKYDLDSGDLAFSREYSEDHYFLQEVGRGYGIVARNGDLDVIYKVEHQDVLGEVWTTEFHEVREGCYGTVTELYSDVDGDEFLQEYRFASDEEVKVHFVTVIGGEEETTDGSDFADGSGTRLRTYDSDGYGYTWDTTLNASGGYSAGWDYSDYDRDYVYEGQDEGRVNGSRIRDYTIIDADGGDELASWHEERGYDGSGEAQITYDSGVVCEYDYSDWNNCSCSCDNGSSCSC